MTEERVPYDAGSGVPSVPVEGTPPATQQQAGTPSAELESLRAKIAELEERLAAFPSEDAIAEKVIGHPRIKQSQRDMIAAQVSQRTQEIFEQLTQPIDELEAEGLLADPAAAARKRRDAFKRAKELAAQEIAPQQARQQETLPDPGTEALMILSDLGLTWADFPEWKPGQRVSISEIRRVAPLRAAQKYAARIEEEKKTAWMKEYEQKVKAAQQGEGAATPPPEGGGGGNPIAKIEDRDELYHLARLEMERARRR